LKKAMRKIALPYAAPLMAITILAMTLTQAMTCMSGVVPHKTEGRIQLLGISKQPRFRPGFIRSGAPGVGLGVFGVEGLD
jgi:hypothetical protein